MLFGNDVELLVTATRVDPGSMLPSASGGVEIFTTKRLFGATLGYPEAFFSSTLESSAADGRLDQ